MKAQTAEIKNAMQDTRVGIYGGTFDPVHNGHIEAARQFAEQMRLDYLFIVPTGIPPHKEVTEGDDPRHRLRMCELAFSGMDGVVVTDMEIAREGKSFTVDTLRELSAPGRRLLLLCGTDMVLSFDKWKDYKEILKLCYPVYIRREKDKLLDGMIVSKLAQYYEISGKMFRKIICEPIEMSSAEVRSRVARGEDISHMVPASVAAYIEEHGLYKK